MTELFRNNSPGALTRQQAVELEKKRMKERVRKAQELAAAGRGEDTEIAHVSLGELVVPAALQSPEVLDVLRRTAAFQNIPFDRLRVGSPKNSINPNTGVAEFGSAQDQFDDGDDRFDPQGMEWIGVNAGGIAPDTFFGNKDNFGGTDRTEDRGGSPYVYNGPPIGEVVSTAPPLPKVNKMPNFRAPQTYTFGGPTTVGLPGSPSRLRPTNTDHVNAFFDAHRDRLTALADEMHVAPNFLIGLAAGESNWGRPQGQNNLFGMSVNEKPLNYPDWDSAIDAFRRSHWYSRLQGKTEANDFLNELVNTRDGKNMFNSVREGGYAPWVDSLINTVDHRLPIWQQTR